MFGDLNDENSEVTKWRNNERNYFMLEELGIKPTVSYLVKVRNQEEAMHHEDMERHATDAEHKEEKHS
jgi:Fe-S-cluster-containing dehydrogenase component